MNEKKIILDQSRILAVQSAQLSAQSRQIEALLGNVKKLTAEVSALKQEEVSLKAEVFRLRSGSRQLTARLALNSRNSSLLPSSDVHKPRQTQSLRKKSDKNPGSQPGHRGDTLSFSSTPDHIVDHRPDICRNCSRNISGEASGGYQLRQVYDIPPIKLEVTELRGYITCCPHCQERTIAAFPEPVSQPTQYSSGVCALGAYLTQYRLLPYERTAEISENLLGHRVSVSFLCGNNRRLAKSLSPFINVLVSVLKEQGLLHADETGYKQGVVKKMKIRNLLQRFIDYQDDILRFAHDFTESFTSNTAEQAVRMTKAKQKISGSFRSEQGGNDFARIRSYIDTMKKQGQNIMDSIRVAFEGYAFSIEA